MSVKKKILILVCIITIAGFAWALIFYQNNLQGIGPALKPPPQDITKIINATGMPLSLPEGFTVSIFAKDLENPRVLAFDPHGIMLASIPSQGKVVTLPNQNDDEKTDSVTTIIEGLNRPHGLAFRCEGENSCRLYIAESHQVTSYAYDSKTRAISDKKKITDLPNRGNHFTRTIIFAPDGRLLISVGSSCNVCHEKEWQRAKNLSVQPDGSDLKEFARGLRNSVFMAIHPVTKQIWATEMGRDLIGDDIPPDEVNVIQEGKNYGWPICYGKNVHDTFFDKNTYIRNPCMEPFETPSLIDLPAHSAPLGLAFIPDSWGETYAGDLLVALHGSWNRSEPSGYKIVRYDLDRDGKLLNENPTDFISGWLVKDGALGRPVDLVFDIKGDLYVSDDKAAVIYKIEKIR